MNMRDLRRHLRTWKKASLIDEKGAIESKILSMLREIIGNEFELKMSISQEENHPCVHIISHFGEDDKATGWINSIEAVFPYR